jgi:two-component system chemotaxis response regulator CheY
MPDINGLELISFIRNNENYRNTPLIIISTESSERDREKGMSLGANAYLVKPFAPDQLQQLLRDYLEG